MTQDPQTSTAAPASSQQRMELAKKHFQSGELEPATRICREILRGEPSNPEALHLLGILAFRSGKAAMAEDLLRLAITFNRSAANYFCNLAQVLASIGRFDEAIEFARRATEMKPTDVDSHYILGKILRSARQLPEAIASYQRAIDLAPDHAHAHSNMGLTLLLKGDFPQGWRELEWRAERRELRPFQQDFAQPRWDGSPLEGRSILLPAEHGFGDAIHFMRYAAMVAQRGAGRIILQVQPELVRLTRSLAGVAEVISQSDPLPQNFDVYCPLMSLPLIFDTTLETIPAPVPYLAAEPNDVDRWRSRIAANADPSKQKIGLVCAGRTHFKADRKRSVSLDQLAALMRIPSVQVFSLQKGPPTEQLAGSPHREKVIDWTADLNDFSDTAALIENLDLIITVDTAVAHLAGALNKPVWALIPSVPDWRWLLDRDDSPWYPSMKLFRQPTNGDWETPIGQIVEHLRHPVHG